MLAGSWSRNDFLATPRMKPNFSTCAGKLVQPEGGHVPLEPVVELEALEVADQDEAGSLALAQGVEVTSGLFIGGPQIAPRALLFDDQDARPEEVEEPAGVVQLPDPLFVAGDGLPAHPEYVEEVVVEALRLAFLIAGVRPLPGEGCGTGPDLVPGKAHAAAYCRSRPLMSACSRRIPPAHPGGRDESDRESGGGQGRSVAMAPSSNRRDTRNGRTDFGPEISAHQTTIRIL